jgi:hypothetical protein
MMVRDLYQEAVKNNHYSLKLMIEYLINERKVLKMTDNSEQLTYYLQDKFAKRMNEYLADYKER